MLLVLILVADRNTFSTARVIEVCILENGISTLHIVAVLVERLLFFLNGLLVLEQATRMTLVPILTRFKSVIFLEGCISLWSPLLVKLTGLLAIAVLHA